MVQPQDSIDLSAQQTNSQMVASTDILQPVGIPFWASACKKLDRLRFSVVLPE